MRLRVSAQLCTCLRRRYTTVTGTASQVQQPLNYVNGQRNQPPGQDPANRFDLINPATGEVLRQIQNSGVAEVDGAITVAQQAFPAWSQKAGFDRGQVLRKAAQLIRERCEELARTEVLDTGKPIWEARYDIQGCADTIDYYGGLAAAITGDFTQLAGGSFAYTIREALGVVGAIGAWNYPFQMAAWKSSPALACGNTIVFKPSPLTPLTAVMLGEIYAEAGLPDGCYNVIQDIKHVTLELGGKSPLIIFSDADMDNAVKGAMLANFSNQGQVCSNGTRVFVQKDVVKEFLKKLVERTQRMKIGDPNVEDTTVGATISSSQADKVLAYVQGAKKEGATVVYGGERVSQADPRLAQGHYLSPCILADCHDHMTVVREEVFGSVMSVLTFDTEEEVLRRANETEFGLAGGVFTRDLSRAHRVAAGMEAGSLYVNNYNVYPVGVPFGGFKKSGIGRENGRDTLDYYSQIKSVYVEMNDVDCPY